MLWTRTSRIKLAAIVLTVIINAFLLCACGSAKAESASDSRFAMNTYMTVIAYGDGAEGAVSAAFGEIARLEGILSVTDSGSEVAKINSSGGADAVSAEVDELLSLGQKLWRETDGALDITIYPALRLWGFTTGEYGVPSDEKLKETLYLTGAEKLRYSGGSLALPEGGMIDFGSLAKGYAADRVAALLQEKGIAHALLDLGGNIHAIGGKPDGSPWRVAVAAPGKGEEYLGYVDIYSGGVVTSGGYERYFEQAGEVYWHILDPKTGYPARSGLLSATVVGESGAECDGRSTALFVMGIERAIEYYRAVGGFDMVLVSDEGKVYVTEGLESTFVLLEDEMELVIVRRDGGP